MPGPSTRRLNSSGKSTSAFPSARLPSKRRRPGSASGFDYDDGPSFADRNAPAPYNLLDWRSNFDGQTTLLLNGVDVVQLSHSLHAAEDEELTKNGEVILTVLGVAAFGGLVYLGFRKAKDCLDNHIFDDEC